MDFFEIEFLKILAYKKQLSHAYCVCCLQVYCKSLNGNTLF